MRVLGEICLLLSLVAIGYAAVLSIGRGAASPWTRRLIALATTTGFASLTVTTAVLIWALVTRNFHFEYVAQYASRLLPWQYCLSALWVGQAGSLLLWAWIAAMLAIVLRCSPASDTRARDVAFGLVLANVTFLIVVMVFAADPMAASVIASEEGGGLSPLLQHPSMLVHPPIVFLAYAAWSVPCALALAALWLKRTDIFWTQMARPWALFAWTILGIGLLLGANWAYQELGWGGYWGWDPVENGSLLPWLTGTAFIHCMMTWRHCGGLQKTTFALAVVTSALCNFATFLTRSGIFSSVHAFSESPIGWMFLLLMASLVLGAAIPLVRHLPARQMERFPSHLLARESFVLISTFLMLALTVVVLVGTLVAPVSKLMMGRMIQVGPEFYNSVLPPIGLGLLAMTAAVPLLRWRAPPTTAAQRLLAICAALSAAVAFAGYFAGIRHPVAVTVVGLASLTAATFIVAIAQSVHHGGVRSVAKIWSALSRDRRKLAAYSIHLGFVCVAIGIAGSSLGTYREELTLAEGNKIHWQGWDIHYTQLEQRQLPDKLVAEAVLQVTQPNDATVELRPARHLHMLQNEWTTEVAIHSTWSGDLYTILNAGLGEGRIAVTFVSNPLVRWIWLGGYITTIGAVFATWPTRRAKLRDASEALDDVKESSQIATLRYAA